jgi:hypothetical protein
MLTDHVDLFSAYSWGRRLVEVDSREAQFVAHNRTKWAQSMQLVSPHKGLHVYLVNLKNCAAKHLPPVDATNVQTFLVRIEGYRNAKGQIILLVSAYGACRLIPDALQLLGFDGTPSLRDLGSTSYIAIFDDEWDLRSKIMLIKAQILAARIPFFQRPSIPLIKALETTSYMGRSWFQKTNGVWMAVTSRTAKNRLRNELTISCKHTNYLMQYLKESGLPTVPKGPSAAEQIQSSDGERCLSPTFCQ